MHSTVRFFSAEWPCCHGIKRMPFCALVLQDEIHAECAAPTVREERRHVVSGDCKCLLQCGTCTWHNFKCLSAKNCLPFHTEACYRIWCMANAINHVTVREILSPSALVFPISTIPPTLQNHISFICLSHYIIWTNSPVTHTTSEDNLQSDHNTNLNSCVANYLMLCTEDNTCIALNIRQCVLDFILSRDILPRCQKNSFVHLSIFSKENIHWDLASKVEYINVVFNGNLH